MLKPLAILLVCQLAGETVARALSLPLPGPVVGLILLVAALLVMARFGRVETETIDSTPLGTVANGLLATLGLLFVPAGVGVIQHLGLLSRHGLALLLALLVSTVLTLIVTVWVFVWSSRLFERDT
jgi:putative effector of murein hydrolase LrgA (UPF0299 family)